VIIISTLDHKLLPLAHTLGEKLLIGSITLFEQVLQIITPLGLKLSVFLTTAELVLQVTNDGLIVKQVPPNSLAGFHDDVFL
jgi:hypothetical protein